MARPAPRELEVIRCQQLTPHMRRITLGGEAMANFPQDQESAYIKLMFPQRHDSQTLTRTYTVRYHRQGEIDVDFALHEQPGPASQWAMATQPGDRILVGGPGPKKLINHDADWYVLAGDMTALPALSVNLAQLPAEATGYAIIEVVSGDDIQSLAHPEGVQLHWLVNPTPDPEGATLAAKVQSLPWLAGQPAVWATSEFQSMRALRRFFKQDRGVAKSHLYISSYWKIGQSEDQHKIAKRRDAEQGEI